MKQVTEETLATIKEALAKGGLETLQKAFTQATGLVNFDLQPAARILYPVITPLRNMIPRVPGNGGTGPNWRAITAINTANMLGGVAEGLRSGIISTSVKSYFGNYKTIGLEDNVSFEADFAGQGFDDVKARAVEGLLRSTMIVEENVLLGGNTSKSLGTPGTPALTTSTTGGAIGAAATVSVIVVALTHDGFRAASVLGGIPTLINRTNADASVTSFGGGSSNKSAAASVVTGAGATNSVSASVAISQGAMAYAWFWGTAGAEVLGAITTINSVLITTAFGTGTQTAASIVADNSTNAFVYDGLLYLALGAGLENPSASSSGSLVAFQATGTPGTGTPLTSDGAGGVVEIDTDLRSFWDNFKLSPTHIFVSAQELGNITKKVVAGGGTPLFRFAMDGAATSIAQGTVQGGVVIGTYLNKFTMGGGHLLKVVLHPNLTPGTILYYSDVLNYPLSNVQNLVQFKARRDYYQMEWPLRTRKYEYGVYADGLLQHYFPPAMGVRGNIANG